MANDDFQDAIVTKQAMPEELKGIVSPRALSWSERLRVSIYVSTGTIALVCMGLSVATGMDMLPWHKKYMTDWFIVALIFGAGPYSYFYLRNLKRIQQIDEKFPDFLRDIAESARAGMTLPRALVTASYGSYGALNPEIKKMSAQVEWGVAFTDALQRFASRTRSPLIVRVVSLIIEARRAGGNVVDILTAASDDAREIKQIITGRRQAMGAYTMVIYITFFVFIAVVFILQAQFIPAFKAAVDAAGGNARVGGISFAQFDPEDFNTMFFHAALVQAIGGGLVGGVLTKGNPIAGMKSILIMTAVAWFSFRVLTGGL